MPGSADRLQALRISSGLQPGEGGAVHKTSAPSVKYRGPFKGPYLRNIDRHRDIDLDVDIYIHIDVEKDLDIDLDVNANVDIPLNSGPGSL